MCTIQYNAVVYRLVLRVSVSSYVTDFTTNKSVNSTTRLYTLLWYVDTLK